MAAIDEVLTITEAAELCGKAVSTLRMAAKSGKFQDGEIRKSGTTWIITRAAMERLYGKQEE